MWVLLSWFMICFILFEVLNKFIICVFGYNKILSGLGLYIGVFFVFIKVIVCELFVFSILLMVLVCLEVVLICSCS